VFRSEANRITEFRAVAGMSQAELGDRVGVTRQTVNAIEGGKYFPFARRGLQGRLRPRRAP
jgi:DNA-binding XRE family transcriptional regulator